MVRSEFDNIVTSVRREADDISSTLREAATSIRDTIKDGSFKDVPRRINEPTGFDPIKFRKFLVLLIKLLVVLELVGAITEGLTTDSWKRLGTDLIIAGIVYVMWDRITSLVVQKKDEYRLRMEHSAGSVKLWDAFVFSLLWSDEIYTDIPQDMRRLIVIAYTLIAISIGAIFVGIGQGLMGLIVCSALILAAVNLLAWVVSRERGEKDTLKTELKLAHDVQMALMPKSHPRVEGLDVAGFSLPAKEVGGDHFDYALIGNDSSRFGVCVFDVSGKGMHAAMSAVFMSGAFASDVKRASSVAESLTRLNKLVCSHSRRGHFIAFLLTVFDMHERRLCFANAGQTKPLLRSNGRVEWLDSSGVHFPLGMKEDSAYEERSIELQSGDLVVLLTDGFTEAMNAQREQFGMERIEEIVRRIDSAGTTSQQIVDRIRREVEAHVSSAPQHDDMTMVVVVVKNVDVAQP